jgi:hypothetical protein
MSLNVSEFQSVLARRRGIQQSNHYKVILPTLGVSGQSEASGPELNLLCTKVSLPGFDVKSNAARKTGPRVQYGLPSSYGYTPATFEFIETGDNVIQLYIEDWLSRVVDEYGNISFYDDITRDIRVFSLDKEGNEISETVLYECYPTTKPGIEYSNDTANSPIKVAVGFFVNYYEHKVGE